MTANKINSRFLSNPVLISILIIISLAVWGITVHFEFLTFDDETFITKNPVIANTDIALSGLLNFKFGQADYFPLSFLFWRGLNEFFGLNPFVFHLMNVLLHAANVILVYFFSLKLLNLTGGKYKHSLVAACIALAFSIHPIHVESVAWVICLKDMLFTLFYLAGFIFYMKWKETGKSSFFYLALTAALLSMLSKSMGITFIAMTLVFDYLYGGKISKKLLISKIPFLLITIFGFWIFGLLGDPFNTFDPAPEKLIKAHYVYYPGSISGNAILKYISIASFRILFWIKQLILPFGQTVFYNRKELLQTFAGILPYTPLIIGVLAAFIMNFGKKDKLLLAGFITFAITISPALAQTDFGISTFVPDRYLYLPILGFLIMAASLIMKMNKNPAIIVSSTFFIFWLSTTLIYVPSWRSSKILYDTALEKDPKCPEALMNRSVLYFNEGEKEKGLADLDRLILYHPGHSIAYYNRIKFYMSEGKYEETLDDYSLLLKNDSLNFQLLVERGFTYMKMDSLEKARTDFSKAYDIDSTHYALNKNIAGMYNRAQNHGVALIFANKCLEQNPNDIDVLRIKGVAQYFNGNYTQAIQTFNRVIVNNDQYGEVWFFLSMSEFMTGNFDKALQNIKHAIELEYQFDEGYLEILNDSIKTLANR